METLVIQAKNKATSNHVKKLLKELEGIECVSTLSASDREDLAMINAINKGRTGNYVDTETFLKKLRGK
ncbi:MAG: hypothetical protein M3Z26_10930 [Bacteroidota bacterium]|nr:hypothetical protein [Bacteroidota bacterium]